MGEFVKKLTQILSIKFLFRQFRNRAKKEFTIFLLRFKTCYNFQSFPMACVLMVVVVVVVAVAVVVVTAFRKEEDLNQDLILKAIFGICKKESN